MDESKCEKLIQMGFQRNSAIKALQDCNNNVDSAVEVLLKQSDGSNSNRNFSQQPRRDSYRDRAGMKLRVIKVYKVRVIFRDCTRYSLT